MANLVADATDFDVAATMAYEATTPARYDIFNDVHPQLLNNDAYLKARADETKANQGPYTVTGFTQSSAPYTATLTVSGMTTSDSPIISFYTDGTNLSGKTPKEQKKAFSCVDRVETTAANTLTFYCYSKKPANGFNVMVKGK